MIKWISLAFRVLKAAPCYASDPQQLQAKGRSSVLLSSVAAAPANCP